MVMVRGCRVVCVGFVCGEFFFFKAEGGRRFFVRSVGLGDLYRRQVQCSDYLFPAIN